MGACSCFLTAVSGAAPNRISTDVLFRARLGAALGYAVPSTRPACCVIRWWGLVALSPAMTRYCGHHCQSIIRRSLRRTTCVGDIRPSVRAIAEYFQKFHTEDVHQKSSGSSQFLAALMTNKAYFIYIYIYRNVVR
jgi:hypothetical protein